MLKRYGTLCGCILLIDLLGNDIAIKKIYW